MNITDFLKLYKSRAMCLRALFAEKHKQYGTAEDVFKNNVEAAALAELSPERFLMIQVSKHVAVLNTRAKAWEEVFLEKVDESISEEEIAKWRENMDDISVWMFILNGLLEERFQRGVAEGGT